MARIKMEIDKSKINVRCHYCGAHDVLHVGEGMSSREIFDTHGWDLHVTLRCRRLCPKCAQQAIAGGHVNEAFRNGRKWGERSK